MQFIYKLTYSKHCQELTRIVKTSSILAFIRDFERKERVEVKSYKIVGVA